MSGIKALVGNELKDIIKIVAIKDGSVKEILTVKDSDGDRKSVV